MVSAKIHFLSRGISFDFSRVLGIYRTSNDVVFVPLYIISNAIAAFCSFTAGPKKFPHQAYACQGATTEQTFASVDPYAN